MEGLLGCQIGKNALLLSIMDIIRKISKKFKIAMIMHDPEITVEDLAEKAGLSRQTISKTLSGNQPKVAFTTIVKMAKALELKLDDLIEEKDVIFTAIAAEDRADYQAKKKSGISSKGAPIAVPRRAHKRAG